MVIEVEGLKSLRFEFKNEEHCVSLVDNSGFPIVRGYGKTLVEAINDLHSNFL